MTQNSVTNPIPENKAAYPNAYLDWSTISHIEEARTTEGLANVWGKKNKKQESESSK